MNVGGFRIRFAPERSPEAEIPKRINRALERAGFAIFIFPRASAIDDAIRMALRAGVEITA